MADNINVSPTPIQRNSLDVATELTELYYSSNSVGDIQEIQETFLKFYAIADMARRTHHTSFKDFLPENVSKLIK